MGQECQFYPVVVSAKPRQDGNLSSYTSSKLRIRVWIIHNP